MAKALAKVWLVKVRGVLGPDPGDDKAISILNRIVRWEKDHLRYEADPRHVEKLSRDLGMDGSRFYSTLESSRQVQVLCWKMVAWGAALRPYPPVPKQESWIAKE